MLASGEDNSGKSNIFPNINKPFISSPVSEQVASQGLGGAQGGAIVVSGLLLLCVCVCMCAYVHACASACVFMYTCPYFTSESL